MTWRGVRLACLLLLARRGRVHGLGAGSDTRLSGALRSTVSCVAAVVSALGWRLAKARAVSPGWRLGAAACGVFMLFGVAVFALVGPLGPGRPLCGARPARSLSQLGLRASASGAVSSGAGVELLHHLTDDGARAGPAYRGRGRPIPFSSSLSGTYSTSGPDSAGQVRVLLSMRVQSDGAPLVVTLRGRAVDGGVAMASSQVTFGSQGGVVTFLEGSTVRASVSGSGESENLTLQLNLNQTTGMVTGTVSGAPGGRSGDGGGQ